MQCTDETVCRAGWLGVVGDVVVLGRVGLVSKVGGSSYGDDVCVWKCDRGARGAWWQGRKCDRG